MIIYGSMTIHKTLHSQEFFCPYCEARVYGDVKLARRWFMIYFIPLFPQCDLGEFVECTACKEKYQTGILDRDPSRHAGSHGHAGNFPLVITEEDLEEVPDPRNIRTGPSPQPRRQQSQLPQIRTAPGRGAAPNSFAVNSSSAKAKLPKRKVSLCAIAGLIVGIVAAFSLLLTSRHILFTILTWPIAFAGLILSGIGFSTIQRVPLRVKGRGIALSGLGVSGVALVAGILIGSLNPQVEDRYLTPDEASQAMPAMAEAKRFILKYGNLNRSNCEEGQPLIDRLVDRLKAADTGPARNRPSVRIDDYRGWCELNGRRCTFLIYLPDDSKLETYQRDPFLDAAWKGAREIAIPEVGRRGRLAVGLYTKTQKPVVMSGPIGDEKPSSTLTHDYDLAQFFVRDDDTPPTAPPAASPSATKT